MLLNYIKKASSKLHYYVGWWILVSIGFLILYIPVYAQLFLNESHKSSGSYSWLVALIAFYLFFQNRLLFFQPNHFKRTSIEVFLSLTIYIFGLIIYILGRSQSIQSLTLSSQVFVLLGLIIFFKGVKSAQKCWFGLFFLIFIIPLPAYILDPVTLPMKIMVSVAVEWILQHLGYLVGRDGVILQVEQYQLLVADACAGMKTLLSLEAMGLLYLHVVKRDSLRRNLLLGLLIIPISLLANILRVTILALITYHLGDAAGKGFMHFYAGIVLFIFSLSLIMFIDNLIELKIEYKNDDK